MIKYNIADDVHIQFLNPKTSLSVSESISQFSEFYYLFFLSKRNNFPLGSANTAPVTYTTFPVVQHATIYDAIKLES